VLVGTLLLFVVSITTGAETLNVGVEEDSCSSWAADVMQSFENEYGCLDSEQYNYAYNYVMSQC